VTCNETDRQTPDSGDECKRPQDLQLQRQTQRADSILGQQKLEIPEQPEAQVAHQRQVTRYCHQSGSLDHGQRSVSSNIQCLQPVRGYYVSYHVNDATMGHHRKRDLLSARLYPGSVGDSNVTAPSISLNCVKIKAHTYNRTRLQRGCLVEQLLPTNGHSAAAAAAAAVQDDKNAVTRGHHRKRGLLSASLIPGFRNFIPRSVCLDLNHGQPNHHPGCAPAGLSAVS
jgi:hypothetical protein